MGIALRITYELILTVVELLCKIQQFWSSSVYCNKNTLQYSLQRSTTTVAHLSGTLCYKQGGRFRSKSGRVLSITGLASCCCCCGCCGWEQKAVASEFRITEDDESQSL